MRTNLENILLLLLGSDFTESDGDVEAPTGYFGYFVLDDQFLEDVKNAFGGDAVSALEIESLEGLQERYTNNRGVLSMEDSNGFVTYRVAEIEDVKSAFYRMQTEYRRWLGEPEF